MSAMSSNLLDAWPIQSTKRVRRKPQRLVEDNNDAASEKRTVLKAPRKKNDRTEAGKSNRQTRKRKVNMDEAGSSSNTENCRVQTCGDHDENHSYYPGDTPGSITSIPTMHVVPSKHFGAGLVGKEALDSKTKEASSHASGSDKKSDECEEEELRVTFTDAEKAKILNYPIVILKNLFPEDVNKQMRDFDDIIANYGNQMVDVLKQNPRDVGFNLSDHTNERQTLKRFLKYYLNVVEKSKKMKERFAKKGIRSIQANDFAVDRQDYIQKYSESVGHKIMKNAETKMSDSKTYVNPKKKAKLKRKDLVKYCVNVDMRKWNRYRRLLKTRLPRFLLCQEDDDILRPYVRILRV